MCFNVLHLYLIENLLQQWKLMINIKIPIQTLLPTWLNSRCLCAEMCLCNWTKNWFSSIDSEAAYKNTEQFSDLAVQYFF